MINKFLELSNEEKNSLIMNTAEKMNMPEAIIEKDFWVCFMLDYLFTTFKYKDFICFKGGTSLSKVYHCIERFSEDIDLSLDWSVLGFNKEEAYILRSNRQQDIFNKNINLKTEKYLKEIFLPLMKKDFFMLLKDDYELYIDENNPQTICFQYPRVYQDMSILQIIRLEIGVLAEPIPSYIKTVKPYIEECYSNLFNNSSQIIIRTVDINRTFFEKITILHREAYRTNGNYPMRYSRHFYDLYQMIENGIADNALKNIEIIKMVVEFKNKFYPCNWANYNDVLNGNCKLIPNQEALDIFSKDYEKMKNMFYGNYPTFNEIIKTLSLFEIKLNSHIKNNVNV